MRSRPHSALLLPAFLLTVASMGCGDDGSKGVAMIPAGDAAQGDMSTVDDMGTQVDMGPADMMARDPFEVTWTSLEDRPCPEDSILTYQNFGHEFMLNWCSGCHNVGLAEGDRAGATLGIDLDSYDGVQMHLARIWARSADNNQTMPPTGGIDQESRFRLGEWLACGAPR